MRFYAVAHVLVVEADNAEAAYGAASAVAGMEVVYQSEAHPITPEMAKDADWQTLVFYGASEGDVNEGRVLPLMSGDDGGPCPHCGSLLGEDEQGRCRACGRDPSRAGR